MVRFIRAAKGKMSDGADCYLGSLGFALLVLSILLVPTNRMLADTGGGGSPLAVGCKANNGCNISCTLLQNGFCSSPDNTTCGTAKVPGCSACGCGGCFYGLMNLCGCQCEKFRGTCTPGPLMSCVLQA
jgi:hypothetical protein